MKKLVPYGVLAIAIIFIVIGVYREEVIDLFTKAIFICLECIGIG